MTDSSIRVAVLVDGPEIDAWELQALTKMFEETPTEIRLIVENEGFPADDESLADRNLLEKIPHLARVIYSNGGGIALVLERKLRNRFDLDDELWSPSTIYDVPDQDEVEVLTCTPEPTGKFGYSLPEETVEEVGSKCDLVVRLGFGILKGRILTCTEYGVLSFHHGDLRKYRGGPPVFWEFIQGEDEVGVTLQRLNEVLDGGEIVAIDHVKIGPTDTFYGVKSRLYQTSTDLLAEGVSNLLTEGWEPESTDELGDLYTSDDLTLGPVAKYYWKRAVSRLKHHISNVYST